MAKSKGSKSKKSGTGKAKKSNQEQQRQSAMSVCGPMTVVALVFVAILLIFLAWLFYTLQKEPAEVGKKPELKEEKQVTKELPSDCYPVYFLDSTAQFLVPVHISVSASMSAEEKARKIVEKLIEGPPNDALQKVMPKGTRVNSVKFDMNIVTVDFTEDIVSYGGGRAFEEGIVNSLLYSLTEIPEVNKVQISIENRRQPYLPEGTPIDEPLYRRVGPNSQFAVNEGEPSGYMYYIDRRSQFIVPVYMSWKGSSGNPADKLKALYEQPSGIFAESLMSPAPEGIRIIKCEVEDEKLTLVLDHDNFANIFIPQTAKKFLEATYLTLWDMKKFKTADITVGTGQEAVSLWNYSAFERYRRMEIPPRCYNNVSE